MNSDPAESLQEAHRLDQAGQWDRAAEAYRAYLEFQPGDAAVLADFGGLLWVSGKLEQGQELCRRALSLDPTCPGARINLGCILVQQRQFDEAEGLFRRVLAADPTQGFLRRRQSWIAAGIDVRGRTTRLLRAYRNTRSILRYAREFYESRRDPAENEADLNVPNDEQLAAIGEAGEAPTELHVPGPQEEIARAANEAFDLRQRGLQCGKLLILHANSSLETSLRGALERKLGQGQVHDAKAGRTPSTAFCTLTTLHAATGLEAPVVILLGMDHLLESEEDSRLSAEERRDLRRDHTRMLYMGFTRAGQRLVVIRSLRGG